MLSTKYRLFLLSNGCHPYRNIRTKKWSHFYSDFYNCFEKSISPLKLGCESQTLKFKYVLNEHDLQAKRTLFIDDKKKILTLRFIRFTSMEFTGKRRRGGLIQ
jgi:putative hydrolase of the HAD superfamily